MPTLELRQFLSTRPALCRTPTSFASLASSVAMTDISIGCAQAGGGVSSRGASRGAGWRGRTRLLTLACSICCSAAARVFWSGDMQFISSGVTSMAPASRGLTNTRESCQGSTVVVSAAQLSCRWVRLQARPPPRRWASPQAPRGRPAVHPRSYQERAGLLKIGSESPRRRALL